jgi:hypothetical protein
VGNSEKNDVNRFPRLSPTVNLRSVHVFPASLDVDRVPEHGRRRSVFRERESARHRWRLPAK